MCRRWLSLSRLVPFQQFGKTTWYSRMPFAAHGGIAGKRGASPTSSPHAHETNRFGCGRSAMELPAIILSPAGSGTTAAVVRLTEETKPVTTDTGRRPTNSVGAQYADESASKSHELLPPRRDSGV